MIFCLKHRNNTWIHLKINVFLPLSLVNKCLILIIAPYSTVECLLHFFKVRVNYGRSVIYLQAMFYCDLSPDRGVNYLSQACMPSYFSHVQLFATPWTVAHQAPLSMGFSRQEFWSGLPRPLPCHLPNPGIEPRSPALQADSLPSEPPANPPTVLAKSNKNRLALELKEKKQKRRQGA